MADNVKLEDQYAVVLCLEKDPPQYLKLDGHIVFSTKDEVEACIAQGLRDKTLFVPRGASLEVVHRKVSSWSRMSTVYTKDNI